MMHMLMYIQTCPSLEPLEKPPTSTLPEVKTMSLTIRDMPRWQVEEELDTHFGILPPQDYSAVMLKSLLAEKRAEEKGKKEKMPQKKDALLTLAKSLGIPTTDSMTNPILQRKIQDHWNLAQADGTFGGYTVYSIGKYKNMSYDEIHQWHPSYCQWVYDTAIKNPKNAHPCLIQFANFLDFKAQEKNVKRVPRFRSNKGASNARHDVANTRSAQAIGSQEFAQKATEEYMIHSESEKEMKKLEEKIMQLQAQVQQATQSGYTVSDPDDPMTAKRTRQSTSSGISSSSVLSTEVKNKMIQDFASLSPRSQKLAKDVLKD